MNENDIIDNIQLLEYPVITENEEVPQSVMDEISDGKGEDEYGKNT